ncbi:MULTISPECIES: heme-binding protein [unclassified Frankia]|uniref:GlcG/HbpS family heme-binding protein n=2 Tax=Frankia TaxID=1854 RepID=UPI001EF48FF3|nr:MULTISPECIES: heme-binding protein [unclassified Frankia]
MRSITQAEAAARVEAGIAKSRELGAGMNIAIVDAGGHLVQFVRMDDAWLDPINIALKKARTAAYFRTAPDAVGESCQPDGTVHGIERGTADLITFGGGLPILDGAGMVIGAVGVSGGNLEQDYAVAEVVMKGSSLIS